jgi:hypothetical protein
MADVFDTPQTGAQESSLIDELVGEGKKFATIEDLAKGKLEADSFIEQLQGENKLTREQLIELEGKTNKQATIAELIDVVKGSNKQETEEGNQPISDDILSKKIEEILGNKTVEQTRETNYKQANQAVLDKVNGDVEAAKSYVAERAKQLGTSVEKLKALGEESPVAFRELMKLDPSTGSPGVTSLAGVTPPQNTPLVIEGHKTKAYYDQLKKEIGPQKYWSDTKIQAQYLKDATALEDRFKN